MNWNENCVVEYKPEHGFGTELGTEISPKNSQNTACTPKNDFYLDNNTDWLDGGRINELDFCQYFLGLFPLRYIDGVFYSINGAVPDGVVESMITYKLMTAGVQRRFTQSVKALFEALKRLSYVHDSKLPDDEIHVQNGYLKTDGTFYPDKKFCRNRLCVNYDPNAPKPVRWLKFLDELLAPEDILTLQEFMGYCLINSTKAQAMMFIIGNGGEGKSRIGVVMYRLFN